MELEAGRWYRVSFWARVAETAQVMPDFTFRISRAFAETLGQPCTLWADDFRVRAEDDVREGTLD